MNSQEDLVHLFQEDQVDQVDLGIQCHPADLAENILNKTKPKKCRPHTYTDGTQEYLEDNYIYL